MRRLARMMVQVLDELFVARLRRRMSVPRALTYLALILLIAIVPIRQVFTAPARMAYDGHAMLSLSLAINRAFCRQRSAMSNDVQLGVELQKRPDLASVPILDVVARGSGSVEEYCDTVTSPIVNNENSLMLTEAWLLRVVPRLSLTNVSHLMLGWQIGMLAVLCFALLRAGAGVLMCAGVVQLGIDIVLKVHATHELTVYPFLVCIVAMVIGCYVLSLRRGDSRFFVLCSVILGGITAYVANMRTSYLPLCVAFFVICLVGVLLPDERRVRNIRSAFAACVLFAAGYLVFHYGFIPNDSGGSNSYSYHGVAHPLVLSLAVPNNPLAEREGIRWDDEAALPLAQRVNPSAQYLRPGYENALFSYYFGLWRRYPREMIDLYVEKWRVAGAQVVVGAGRESWNWTTANALAPLGWLSSGVWFLWILLITAVASFIGYRRVRAPLLLGLCCTAVSGVALLAEMTIIMPIFALIYHQSLLFVSGALALAAAQGVVSLLVGAVTLVLTSRRAAGIERGRQSLGDRTIADFGEQWTAYTDNSGFYGSPALLQDMFGPLLQVDDLKGAVVADIGAGTGRFTNVFLASGAAKVVAVEPSRAFDVLTRNTAAYHGQVECVRSDAEHFKPDVPVDFMFSYGVLHHIPDPRASVSAMRDALKSGGRIGIWLYGREGNEAYIALLTALTAVTRQLSHASLETCVSIVYLPTLAYMWLCRVLPLPMRHYFVDVFSKLTPDKRRLVLYDQLNPAYAKYYWQQEVRALLEDAGFVDVRVFHRHGYSWTALAEKP